METPFTKAEELRMWAIEQAVGLNPLETVDEVLKGAREMEKFVTSGTTPPLQPVTKGLGNLVLLTNNTSNSEDTP